MEINTKCYVQDKKHLDLNYVISVEKYVDNVYDIKKTLHQGNFGKVYQVKDRKNKSYVVKLLKDIHKFKSEIEIFSFLQKKVCRNIIGLSEILIEDSYENGCLVMECADFNLLNYIINKRNFSKYELENIMRQILTGLEFCHQHEIVHGDLKPENILVFGHGNRICLSDFGSSYRIKEFKDHPSTGLTLYYQPPEMLLSNISKTNFRNSIDLWSCGVTFLELLFQTCIFYERSKIGVLFKIFQVFGKPKENCYLRNCEYWNESFPNWKLKKSLWIQIDPFFQNIIQNLTKYNPNDRLSCKRILKDFSF